MIERVVLVKLKPEHADEARRRAISERALAELAGLPGVAGVTAGGPADPASAASWDVIIAVRCRSAADLEAYRAHPVHRRFADDFLAPLCDVRKAWNFEVEQR